jgi:hypothetical protein
VLQQRVKVWWEGDRCWFVGTVTAFVARSGKVAVSYDDGDVKRHQLDDSGQERWELLAGPPTAPPPAAACASRVAPAKPSREDAMAAIAAARARQHGATRGPSPLAADAPFRPESSNAGRAAARPSAPSARARVPPPAPRPPSAPPPAPPHSRPLAPSAAPPASSSTAFLVPQLPAAPRQQQQQAPTQRVRPEDEVAVARSDSISSFGSKPERQPSDSISSFPERQRSHSISSFGSAADGARGRPDSQQHDPRKRKRLSLAGKRGGAE